jgi:hypothetical protein
MQHCLLLVLILQVLLKFDKSGKVYYLKHVDIPVDVFMPHHPGFCFINVL